jgi:hypothetical protein
MTTKLGPHGHGRLATFLRARIAELAPTKTQKEVAQQAGYTNANMITGTVMATRLERGRGAATLAG